MAWDNASHGNSSLRPTMCMSIHNAKDEKTTQTWSSQQFWRYNFYSFQRRTIGQNSDNRLSHRTQGMRTLLDQYLEKKISDVSRVWQYIIQNKKSDFLSRGNVMSKIRKRSKIQDTDYKSNFEIIQDWEEQNDAWVRKLGPE